MEQRNVCKGCGKEFKTYKYKSKILAKLYCKECRSFCDECGKETTSEGQGFEGCCNKCSEINFKKYMVD